MTSKGWTGFCSVAIAAARPWFTEASDWPWRATTALDIAGSGQVVRLGVSNGSTPGTPGVLMLDL